jgi:hypothetical protein
MRFEAQLRTGSDKAAPLSLSPIHKAEQVTLWVAYPGHGEFRACDIRNRHRNGGTAVQGTADVSLDVVDFHVHQDTPLGGGIRGPDSSPDTLVGLHDPVRWPSWKRGVFEWPTEYFAVEVDQLCPIGSQDLKMNNRVCHGRDRSLVRRNDCQHFLEEVLPRHRIPPYPLRFGFRDGRSVVCPLDLDILARPHQIELRSEDRILFELSQLFEMLYEVTQARAR